jgi:chitodextrinase
MSDSAVSTWSSTAVYTAGMEVLENGVLYVANWWTSGDNPISDNGAAGTGKPWSVVSSTSSDAGVAGSAPLPAPAVPANTHSTATLSWSAASLAGGATITGYAILESGTEVGTVSGTATSYTVTGLTAMTSYNFTIEAIDSSGASAPSAVVTATTKAAPVPAAPTALAATDVSSNAFVLIWAAPATPAGTTISGYTILYNGTAIGSSNTNSFALSGLQASTSYKLTVEANDASGASVASNALTVTTAAATTAPPNYSGVADWSATAVYTGGQDVAFGNVVYVANYWTQNNNPATDSGASGDAWTVIGKVNNTPEAPNAPTGLTATTLSSTGVSLLWNPATVTDYGAVSGYAIYENGKEIGVTSNTYYNIDSLSAATKYSFAVSAIDVTGGSPPSTAATATTLATGQSFTPTAVFAPYFDMGLDGSDSPGVNGSDSLVAVSEASGIKTFALAFIQSSGAGTIGWGGEGTIAGAATPDGSGTTILSQIKAFQAIGGNVIISFGGENGTDPAAAAGATVASLEAEYQSVINTYGVNELDFDIEGGQVADTASITLRDEALAALEKANPGLQISFTLPVLPTGLDADGLNVVKSAEAAGVKLSLVNIMTMDFGGSFDTGQSMGTMSIETIQATEAQLAAIGETAKIGVTPLIGVNDDSAEVFTLADAQQLADYVATDTDVARVAFWSVGRDNDSGEAESASSSGVTETNYEYSSILEQVTAPTPVTTTTLLVPTTPTGLAAGATTSSSVSLNWSAATAVGGIVTGYSIYANGTLLTTVTGTSYTATNLTASTAYKFTVAAVDSAGTSAQSTALNVTTPAGLVPASPTDLAASDLTSSSLILNWNAATAPAGAALSGYSVLNNGTVVGTTTGTSFTDSSLTAATAYSFSVEAIDQYGTSSPSTALSVTTSSASSSGSGSGNIADWSATAVYTAGDTVQDNGLIYEAGWWTENNSPITNSGTAGSGDVWTVIGKVNTTPTAPDAPTGLTATATADNTIDLYWTVANVEGSGTVSGYDILENGKEVATSANTYDSITGLTASTAYNFAVEAVDATGTSAKSTAVSATTLPAGTTAPTATFAPCVDMGLSTTPSLVTLAAESGVKDFVLGFIQSSGKDSIGWGGSGTITSDALPSGITIQSDIQALQAEGGSVTISFGGSAGTDPAVEAATDGLTAAQLQAEYQSVVARYGVNSLDFDIEGAAVTDTAANTLRDEAVKGLEVDNPGLKISYTLPVLPTGFDSDGLALVDQAVKDAVDINVINIMAMDYGSANDNGGAMGTDAIDAIQATEKQLATAGLSAKIGITPMIGVNDTSGEVFTLADAQQLANYAATNPDVVNRAGFPGGHLV